MYVSFRKFCSSRIDFFYSIYKMCTFNLVFPCENSVFDNPRFINAPVSHFQFTWKINRGLFDLLKRKYIDGSDPE